MASVVPPPQARKVQRHLVLCECQTCGGIIRVTQEERRRHIQKQVPMAVAHIPAPSENTTTLNTTATVGTTALSEPQSAPPSPPSPPAFPSPSYEPAASSWVANFDVDDNRPREDPNSPPESDQICDDDWEAPTDDEDTPMEQDCPQPPSPLPSENPLQQPPPVNCNITPGCPPIVSHAPTHTPPVALHVPLAKKMENDPDPFHLPRPPVDGTPTTATDVHPQTGVYILYMLVTWLHLQFHLPFRACNVLVSVVLLVVQSFGSAVYPQPLTTLPRIMTCLEVEPVFDILPICSGCWEVYPASPSTPDQCSKCGAELFELAGTTRRHEPRLRFPYKSLQSQLEAILALPGIEEKLDSWRSKVRYPGRLTDIFDGEVTQSLKDHEGLAFFRNGLSDGGGPNGELRIGLTLGLDWFSYLRSQIAPSHTSCPISFSIANLPPSLRYRTANLMLSGIMPGPKEQPPDECQRFCRIYVNELIRLWEQGFTTPTQRFPEGRLVRVILICICCDKPAAHKLGGFGSHSHTFFCTRCWITQRDKASTTAFQANGFRARTDAEHRAAGEKYAGLETNAAREKFVKVNAVRWTEFARLPYFNLVRSVVIDPMHNLLLGLVKTHFYHIWVQSKIFRKTKELKALHEILAEFTMPSYLGRLPALVGEPAGGSLTADQWLVLATIVAPISVPKIWDQFMSSPELARSQRASAIQARLNKKKKATEKKKKKASSKKKGSAPPPAPQPPLASDDDDDGDEDLPSCLHPDDPVNFMKLCLALRLLLQREISKTDVDAAEGLLQSYCAELITLYGPDVIRPNHHYAIHTPACVRDFGPMHEFWTFLFEQLNKVLKSYKTNNRSGGMLETTFFREFHRAILTSRLVARAGAHDSSGLLQAASAMMFKASSDDRGTVQALAQELDEHDIDDEVIYSFSPRFETRRLDSAFYYQLLKYLLTVFPDQRLRSWNVSNPLPGSVPLVSEASFFDYVVLHGRRYHSSTRAGNSRNSLVEVFVSHAGNTWVGELLDIIQVDQSPSKYVLGYFRWLSPLSLDLSQTLWQTYEPLGVRLWSSTGSIAVRPSGNGQPPPFFPLHFIKCHVASYEITIHSQPCIATLSIQKH